MADEVKPVAAHHKPQVLILPTVIAVIVVGVMGYLIGQQVSSVPAPQTAAPSPRPAVAKNVNKESAKQEELRLAMRKLWEDHITWTRMVIVDIAGDLPGADADTKRLLKNYDDMESALKPFYGDAAAEKVGDLLKDHLVIAAELVKDAKAGNETKAKEAEARWYQNADDLAKTLASVNPNWPEQAVKDMLHEHLKATKDEAVAQLTKKFDESVAAYDAIHDQALMMADTLTSGLVKQFPEKF